jgi:hypothetical protein
LSNWTIAAGALVVLAVVAVVWFVLLHRYGGQGAQIQLDAIRTAGTLVIGTGGAVALLLTARRQRYTELSLVHTDRDATERRITELYTKAADQLGSDKAPVRLAGLYALERLASSTVEHRQTMVDVICAYLRMRLYTPTQPSVSVLGWSNRRPGPARRRRARTLTDRPPRASPTSQRSRQAHAEQERQVRVTAQDILLRNLLVTAQPRRWWHRMSPPAPAWPGVRLNLAGALVLKFSLSECQLGNADFGDAEFIGEAFFGGAQFTGHARFGRAEFTAHAHFGRALFTGEAYFWGAQFTEAAHFRDAQFTGEVDFGDAQFTGNADFRGALFTANAYFGFAQFTGIAHFEDAQFTGKADFRGARVASTAGPGYVWPPGWTTRPAKPDKGEDPAFLYLTEVEEAEPPVPDPEEATPIT